MPGPTVEELAAMLANYGGTTVEPTPTEPMPEPVKLDLKDQNIPGRAWIPLEEEITEEMPAKLIEALISYINKLDFPPRFKDAANAYAYFGIMSEAQIERINEIADKLANPEPVEEEPAA